MRGHLAVAVRCLLLRDSLRALLVAVDEVFEVPLHFVGWGIAGVHASSLQELVPTLEGELLLFTENPRGCARELAPSFGKWHHACRCGKGYGPPGPLAVGKEE
jgi:hypothetical protein